jgi:two-component system CheB/CheR fusion protein
LDRRPVELGSIITRAIEVCRPDIAARQLQFTVGLRGGTQIVDGDAKRLQQVFWNLLSNAIKFTPQGGRVGIRCWPEADQVVAEISDSGIGIEPAALSRIFNAFEQAERTARRFGGLGLGLAISKTLIELHGGTIAAASAGEGQGATFTVRLPLAVVPTPQMRPEAVSLRERAAEAEPHRRLRILLVEDHGDTARVITQLLQRAGHEVSTVGDMAAALREADQREFDLLVSDLGLPDGSGLELMREFRRRGRTYPGIALTGFGQQADVARSLAAGFASHLTKPVDQDQLERAIAEVCPR